MTAEGGDFGNQCINVSLASAGTSAEGRLAPARWIQTPNLIAHAQSNDGCGLVTLPAPRWLGRGTDFLAAFRSAGGTPLRQCPLLPLVFVPSINQTVIVTVGAYHGYVSTGEGLRTACLANVLAGDIVNLVDVAVRATHEPCPA